MTAVAKDLHRLIRRVGQLTDGQGSVCDLDLWAEGKLKSFSFVITPNFGFYKGGVFKFKVDLRGAYKDDNSPTVFCETDIYHPNIDTTELEYGEGSNICLNILDRGTWNCKFGLEGIVIGVVYLLHNPNLEDPMTTGFDSYMDIEDFEENVKKYMRGEEVDGRQFNADFLKNKPPVMDGKIAGEKTENTTTNNDEKGESNCSEKTFAHSTLGASEEQNVLSRNCPGAEDATKKDGENITGTHSDSNGALNMTFKDYNDHATDNVKFVHNDKTNRNTENVFSETIDTDQEHLMKQLGKIGIKNDTYSGDDFEGCTMITFDDESVLVPYRLEDSLENQGTHKNTADLYNLSEHLTRASSVYLSETTKYADTYSAILVRSIVDELIENAMAAYPDQTESFETNLGIVPLQTSGTIETVLNVSDGASFHTLNVQTDKKL